MKITAIESSIISIPFDMGGPPQHFAGQLWTHIETLLVKVITDTGVVGWGEAFGHVVNKGTKATLDTLVAPLFIGRDPRNINGLMRDMQQALHLLGRNGSVVYALSGIDIALWDIAGKLANQPIYRLLGGSAREELTAYQCLLHYDDSSVLARNCAAGYEAGYRLLKLHQTTREDFLAAKAAVGADAHVMFDVNCPWTVEEAVRMATSLKHDGVYWFEEPVWPPEDHAGLARVRREGIPIAAGENAAGLFDFKSMMDAGAIDIAQPSVIKVGGITEFRRIAALADAYGVKVVPHSPYLGPGLMATLHLAAAMPGNPPIEYLWMETESQLYGDYTVRKGRIPVPQGPGLGCDPDPAVIQRYCTAGPTVIR
jgi:L-alanine-DL-glutamate epimerase-like enolase superfamily enzyme